MTQRQTQIFFHMPSTLCHCACAADSLHEYFGNTQALASINLTFICIIFIILQMWHGGAMITLPPPLTGKLIKLSCFQKMMGQKYSYGHGAKEQQISAPTRCKVEISKEFYKQYVKNKKKHMQTCVYIPTLHQKNGTLPQFNCLHQIEFCKKKNLLILKRAKSNTKKFYDFFSSKIKNILN